MVEEEKKGGGKLCSKGFTCLLPKECSCCLVLKTLLGPGAENLKCSALRVELGNFKEKVYSP